MEYCRCHISFKNAYNSSDVRHSTGALRGSNFKQKLYSGKPDEAQTETQIDRRQQPCDLDTV